VLQSSGKKMLVPTYQTRWCQDREDQNMPTSDTAERSISICREPLQVWVLGVMACLQISPLEDSREETWQGQGIRKRSVSEFAKTKSTVTVERRFRSKYHTEPRIIFIMMNESS
jgi:hypothetical protein